MMKLDCKYFNQVDTTNLNMALFSFLLCAIHLVTGKKEDKNTYRVKKHLHRKTSWIDDVSYVYILNQFFSFISYQNRFGKFTMVNDRLLLNRFPIVQFLQKRKLFRIALFYSMCIISVAIELKKNNTILQLCVYIAVRLSIYVFWNKNRCVSAKALRKIQFFFSMC